MIIGIILIIIGAVALASKLGIISGGVWSFVWPLILIVLGLSLLFRRRGSFFWCGPWRCGPDNRDR